MVDNSQDNLSREQRLAAKLRENLRRRKAQARQLGQDGQAPTHSLSKASLSKASPSKESAAAPAGSSEAAHPKLGNSTAEQQSGNNGTGGLVNKDTSG